MRVSPWGALIFFLGCSGTGTGPERPPEFTGIITFVDSETSNLTSVGIDFDEDSEADAVLRVAQNTRIVMIGGGADKEGDVGQLSPGAFVRAWIDGTELRSDPPQYFAVRMEVEDSDN